jgi:hypothetical protein
MNRKILTLLIFASILTPKLIYPENNHAESSQAGNLSFRLKRLYNLHTEKKDYSQIAGKSDIQIKDDRVSVSIFTKPGFTTENIDEGALETFGVRIKSKGRESISAEIPISELVNVSNAVKDLAYISPPLTPVEHAVTSEGVVLMNADNWQDRGYDGTGVTVAIIDLGFDSLSEAQTAGDIPSSYVAHDMTGGGMQTTTPHGTAVTEAIYDLVPNATYHLYKILTDNHLGAAVSSCISEGVDIINHSCGWYNTGGYYDGTGVICRKADSAINHGILWVNSAGNEAKYHYRAEGFVEYGSGGHHIFNGTNDTINPTGPYADGQSVKILMNWDNYGDWDQDYNLYLARDTGSVTSKWILVDSSKNMQDGSYPPQEDINYTNPDDDAMYGILVKKVTAAANADFTIFSLEEDFDYNIDSSSITDPSTVTDVVSVGAINRLVYNTTGQIESFSSQGPTTDGRTKPDAAAPDYCSSFTYRNFGAGYWAGTSLAAPHTAGICALIKSRYSSFSDTDIRNYLFNNCAVDLGSTGKDNVYGYGKVVMPDISLEVTYPNGGENLYIDSIYNITWTSSGTSGAVKIEYSTNSGSNWSDVIASTTDDGSHPWTIPDDPSENCLVRITDTIGIPSDTSDAVFEISHPVPAITVTSPNGGEEWIIDSTHNITWTSFATSGGVKIEYSVDNAGSWSDVIASMPDTGVYPWTVPDTPSDSCMVRISDTNESISDTSDAWFEISPTPIITITTPNGGENLEVDSSFNISWTSENTSGVVQIEYSTDNGSSWSEVIASMPDTGVYPWTVPGTPSDSCLVRITDTAGSPTDISDSLFVIFPHPYITVTNPNGGETWHRDSIYNITWISSGTSGGVQIEYSINNGADWLDIITSMPDTGVFPWTVPDTPSDSCLVRVTDTTGNPTDISNDIFTINYPVAVPFPELPKVYSMITKTVTANNHLEVKYALPEKANVLFEIYDIKGTKIKEISEEQIPGFYSMKIGMADKPAGVYILRMEANKNKFIESRKFILVR